MSVENDIYRMTIFFMDGSEYTARVAFAVDIDGKEVRTSLDLMINTLRVACESFSNFDIRGMEIGIENA